MTILEILNKIEATRSKNEKIAIMTQHKDNEDLKEFFRLALTGSINFYQKKTIEFVPLADDMKFSLASSMRILREDVSSRKVTGHAARNLCASVMAGSDSDDAEVIHRILKKDPKCGVSSSVNDVWPGLVPEHPNLLASPFSEKLANQLNWKDGCQIQIKGDGLRVSIHVESDSVTVYSRAGNILDLHDHFLPLCDIPELVDHVIDGELMVVKPNGKYEDRKTGNGICGKAIKGTLSKAESERMVVAAWDIISSDEFWTHTKTDLGSEQRYQQLYYACFGATHLIRMIPSTVVYSIKEAQIIHEKYIADGEEGSMWKDINVPWENRRSKSIIKVKAEETVDLKVTGYIPGEGKFTDYIGSLTMETGDGKLIVNMSGFPLKLRAEITANLFNKPVTYQVARDNNEWETFTANPNDCDVHIGTIVEVKYNQKIQQRDSDIWSLFLPRFEKVRGDKTKANTFEEIK